MVSRNWVQKKATETIWSDISGKIIKKGEEYYYNENLDLRCRHEELVQARSLFRALTRIVGQPSSLFLHDRKKYKSARFDSNASGYIVSAVTDKVIKVHGYTIQAQGSVLVNFNDGEGGSEIGDEWSFGEREGAVVGFAPAPAYWFKTSKGKGLYITLSATVTVTINMIYSDDDEE